VSCGEEWRRERVAGNYSDSTSFLPSYLPTHSNPTGISKPSATLAPRRYKHTHSIKAGEITPEDAMPIPYPRQESLSSSSSASSESSFDEDEERALIQEEWEESLRQMEVVMSIIIMPFFGKWFGRQWAYWGMFSPSLFL
jgi:hypothetical protein